MLWASAPSLLGTVDWTAVGVWIALAAVIVTALVGIYQTRRMGQAWQAAAAIEIARELQSQTQRGARQTIYSLKGNEVPYAQWSTEEKEDADSVFQLLNTAAYLRKRRYLPRGMLEDLWGAAFVRCYNAAHERIEDRASKGRTGPLDSLP